MRTILRYFYIRVIMIPYIFKRQVMLILLKHLTEKYIWFILVQDIMTVRTRQHTAVVKPVLRRYIGTKMAGLDCHMGVIIHQDI